MLKSNAAKQALSNEAAAAVAAFLAAGKSVTVEKPTGKMVKTFRNDKGSVANYGRKYVTVGRA